VPTPQLRPILQTRIGQSRRSEWTRCRGVLDSGKRFSARFFGVWVITEAKGAAPTALPRQGPTARRGTAGQAGSSSIDTPALSGWADVWRAGPPGLGNGWVLFCGSLTQELIKLWHGPQPVRQSSKRAVGSEVAHRVSQMLATVRRPNRACDFPAHGFHEDSTSRGCKRRY
jgi:hypothetical protein